MLPCGRSTRPFRRILGPKIMQSRHQPSWRQELTAASGMFSSLSGMLREPCTQLEVCSWRLTGARVSPDLRSPGPCLRHLLRRLLAMSETLHWSDPLYHCNQLIDCTICVALSNYASEPSLRKLKLFQMKPQYEGLWDMSIAIIFPISYFVQLLLVQAASYYVHRGQSESVSGKVGSHEARKLHQRRKPKRQIKGGVHYFVTELGLFFKAVSSKKFLIRN